MIETTLPTDSGAMRRRRPPDTRNVVLGARRKKETALPSNVDGSSWEKYPFVACEETVTDVGEVCTMVAALAAVCVIPDNVADSSKTMLSRERILRGYLNAHSRLKVSP